MTDALRPPAPGKLVIAGLSQANRHKRKFDAVLTLEDPRARLGDRLRFSAQPAPAHLVLRFEDADSEEFGYATATASQVAQALEFGRAHAAGSLLVHCAHGVGRSAAIAYAILADRMGPGLEHEALAEVLDLSPHATPNLIVVEHADMLLGRTGALTEALTAFEAGRPDKLTMRRNRDELARTKPELYSQRA